MRYDGYRSEFARETAPEAFERFFRYVRIDTQADSFSTTVPSTAKQLDFSRLLVDELKHLAASATEQLEAEGADQRAMADILIVMGPGRYRFGDYWKPGLPLLVLFGVGLIVPLFWRF